MARRITIHKAPFDYRWPNRQAITAFTSTGTFLVKDEIADFAIAKGYATEATNGPKAPRKKRAAAKPRRRAGVGNKNAPSADRAADRSAMADNAG
jgi:hypothetical protein